MTLWPCEQKFNVVPCAAEKYELNQTCAHPECDELAVDPHHNFRRSGAGGTSWFVKVFDTETGKMVGPIPHVSGLCRAHHNLVTDNRAWVKYELGEFNWYDFLEPGEPLADQSLCFVGPLDPQPGERRKLKKPRRKLSGEKRRQRKTISLRVPNDAGEDGAGLLEEAIETLEGKLGQSRPPYWTILDGLNYAILNMDETDV